MLALYGLFNPIQIDNRTHFLTILLSFRASMLIRQPRQITLFLRYMKPFRALNILLYNQALQIVKWSASRDTHLQALKGLKQTSTTAKTYRKYITRLNKELREERARVQLRISVFLATYPLVSTLSLATRTLLLNPTLFDRPEDLIIAFHIPVSRLRQLNYIWRQRTYIKRSEDSEDSDNLSSPMRGKVATTYDTDSGETQTTFNNAGRCSVVFRYSTVGRVAKTS